MKTASLYLAANGTAAGEPSPFVRCRGRRHESWEGCPDGCVAHVDRWSPGDNRASVNEILYWMPYVAGAVQVEGWSTYGHSCTSGLKTVQLHSHPSLLQSVEGARVPVWVVIVNDHCSDEQCYALAFLDPAQAMAAMQAEIAVVEEDCDCVSE